MAKGIYVKAKDVSLVEGGESGIINACISLVCMESGKEFNAQFVQPQNLTSAVGGITDYGMLVFNTLNSDIDETVTIACVADDGTEVTVSTTLEDVLDVEVGEEVTTDGSLT